MKFVQLERKPVDLKHLSRLCPWRLVGTYHLHSPEARVIFYNNLLCNDTCPVIGGA